MKKTKPTVSKDASEIGEMLGLSPADALEIEMRSELNTKIIEVVRKKGLTHAQVAKLAETSRTKITAIMNRNTMNISLTLLIRILSTLGVRAKLQFKNWAA